MTKIECTATKLFSQKVRECWEKEQGNEVWTFKVLDGPFLPPSLDKDTGWWYIIFQDKRHRVLSWDETDRSYRLVSTTREYEKKFRSKWKRVSDLVPCLIPRK